MNSKKPGLCARIRRIHTWLICVFCGLFVQAQAVTPASTTEDLLNQAARQSPVIPEHFWMPLQTLIEASKPKAAADGGYSLGVGDDRLKYKRWTDTTRRLMRDWGLEICRQFPDDPRTWQWFVATVTMPPSYAEPQLRDLDEASKAWSFEALSGPIDHDAKAEWEMAYRTLRAAFFASPLVTEEQRDAVLFAEFYARFTSAKTAIDRGSEESLTDLTKELLAYGNLCPSSRSVVPLASSFVKLLEKTRPGSGPRFLVELRNSNNEWLRAFGQRSETLAAARSQPMQINGLGLDGEEVNLDRFRGQVLLIDFGAYTWCGVCASERPKLKELYHKYHSAGFDILTVSCELKEKDRDFVRQETQKEEIGWAHIFYSTGLKNDYIKRYGIVGLPEYFILGKDGLMITARSEAKSWTKMENAIRVALGLQALPEQSSQGQSNDTPAESRSPKKAGE